VSPRSPIATVRACIAPGSAPATAASAAATSDPPTCVTRMSWRGKTIPEKNRAAAGSAASSSVGKYASSTALFSSRFVVARIASAAVHHA
jgi:hypothetical protein